VTAGRHRLLAACGFVAAALQLDSAAVEHLTGRRRGVERVVQTTASRNFNCPGFAIKGELCSRAAALDDALGAALGAEREQRERCLGP
jgi:hypothetical protein